LIQFKPALIKKTSSPKLQSTVIFEEMRKKLNADVVKKVNGIFLFEITDGGKVVAKWSKAFPITFHFYLCREQLST
jgi:hypothetical protein